MSERSLRWLEVENDPSPSCLIMGAMACAVGVAAGCYLNSFWLGLTVTIASAATVSSLVDLLASLRIPAEGRRAADFAVVEFKKLYADCKVASVALRAIEADRYVFSIRYDGPGGITAKPQARRYFAVTRDSGETYELERSDWRPRNLK